tara:strand:+ start:162 stop:743 length:582 start_codon:yes stop_codon:yes gene_type:complete
MTETIAIRKTYRELFRQMDDEYYEAICEWCELQSEDIERSYGNSLYEALMQVVSLEATEHIEEFWHKVAMNYFIPSDDVEYFSIMKLWQKFPYGETYMPCIEELYHKYDLDLDELISRLEITKEAPHGLTAICPVCGNEEAFCIVYKNYNAICLGENCRMNRKEFGTYKGLPIIKNSCHTSYLLHRIHVKEKA